jgi:hypothetical protein
VQYLDTAHPSIRQNIESTGTALKQAHFVEVLVTEVTNPRRYGLTFDVFFEAPGAAAVRLGTFSLYPADNPGKFIVPVSGKLRPGGSLVISMVITDAVDPSTASPRVAIGRISIVQ